MKKPVLMCLLLLSNLTLNTVMASVTVAVGKEQYIFSHEPRLIEILAPIANQRDWYWPGAVLFEEDGSQLEKTRQLLLNNLSTLFNRYQSEKPNLALSIKQLKITISSWCLARRLPIAIDYDLARIVAAANPQLPHGKFILELTERKNTLQLFGAIKKTTEVTHLDNADVSMYLPDQIRSDLANRDFLILIQADGRTIKTPIAYWNKAHQEAMPGSQLFIPFSQSLLQPEFAIINQQIMSLALNRLQQ
ncbi:capsule biosynthesis GfcC family protein [uncultured Paraglaciecola sp.]|jgi:hypothetical protein|uniref:capsule biosynthesis GfcC family protein n=1 Tax=uncultured Paraglaciecola sp. TaxID=1765024 RepID=UPI00261B7951|nr:capsule biosynthesis GfcC family protein [uncultured Paraglaciecola sp.]